MSNRGRFALLLSLAAICLTLGCSKGVTIGAVISESGSVETYGNYVKMGMDLALEEVNASGGVNGGLGLDHQGTESGGIMHGNVGQHLAVNLDPGLIQPVDKAAIRHIVLAGRGIDALDPQRTKRTLAPFTVAVGVLHRFLDRLFGDSNRIFTPAIKAFGGVEDFFVLGVGRHTPFYASHALSLLMIGLF